jgi:hypothetical protein
LRGGKKWIPAYQTDLHDVIEFSIKNGVLLKDVSKLFRAPKKKRKTTTIYY